MTQKDPTAAPGTAVAKRPDATTAVDELLAEASTPQERQRAFALADALKQQRLVRAYASLVAATEWGAAFSPERQAAFSRYCLELGADPLRHVDLLGGNPFPNGDYYRDVIAANPDFDHVRAMRWIHDDPRLRACVGCGKPFDVDPAHGHGRPDVTEENERRITARIERARERIERNATEDSPAICVLVLAYKSRGPFTGIGEVHPGKGSKGNDRDPIGLQHPRPTAETRAWREAGEQAEPVWFRTHTSTLAQLELRLKRAYEAERASVARDPVATAEVIETDEPSIGTLPPALQEPPRDG